MITSNFTFGVIFNDYYICFVTFSMDMCWLFSGHKILGEERSSA